ncbi:MAG: C39 family peptidase [Pirellulaceae bacterium]|nr:C39 family peptidase [Pirellulaceae bacterium]
MKKRWICFAIGIAAATWFAHRAHLEAVHSLSPTDSALVDSPPVARGVLLAEIPHAHQLPDFCGEACAVMQLQHLGFSYRQEDVFDVSGVDPLEARGCYTADLARSLRRIGFQIGPTWRYSTRGDGRELQRQFVQLLDQLDAGWPSIVCMRYDDRESSPAHFRLVVGYDVETDEVIYHEPARADGAFLRLPRSRFLALWPLDAERNQSLIVRMTMRPAKIEPPPSQRGLGDAEYAQHIMRLKRRIPSEDFHIVLERPFVIVGDQSLSQVQRHAKGTVAWSVRLLKQDYFSRDPRRILDIWLFRDKESYEKHALEIFGDEPTTPYGYYSRRHGALIMNIATGGGTLVHEIVHPFMATNFPRCPSWFNEGLASLYEHCSERNGSLWGGVNWRLRNLQAKIGADELSTTESLCATSTREFYGDSGDNYAQARYLCHYLQHRGKLIEFFHRFRRDADSDPTGWRTLLNVLEIEDPDQFEKTWRDYVMRLRP